MFCTLQIVDDVVHEIEQKVAQIESYLETSGNEMNEEVKGKVLAAVGKAKLLISQKIQQFQGLCHKNIVSKLPNYSILIHVHSIMGIKCIKVDMGNSKLN